MSIFRFIITMIIVLASAGSAFAQAQIPAATDGESFDSAAQSIHQQLDDALAELAQLREQIAAEKLPLSRTLSDLEGELMDVRLEYQQVSRLLDTRMLDLSNLRSEIKSRQEEASYLTNLLSEYIRNFESRLHIAELQRYREQVEAARLASENSNLSAGEIYRTQAALVAASLERLDEAAGGARFEGSAIDADGLVKAGTFVLMGPAALFRSADAQHVGTVEQRLGSLEPTVVPFQTPADAEAAAQLVAGTGSQMPFDSTLGNAHVIAETKDTLWEHIKKGGPVMYPIFALAGAAFLVVLYKWLTLSLVRNPSKRRIRVLLDAVARRDKEGAARAAKAIRGPAGRMLAAGVEHLAEPRELIDEVMYEKVLATRLKLQRLLPFVAISAAAAPLLGLLGTVTGIINTFKLITVFGTGDVKTLSGGISEALITTEFGLIVAIPSLLLHALLSRKARGVVDHMDKAAVAFVNQVGKTPYREERTPQGDRKELVEAELPAERSGGSALRADTALEERSHATAQQLRDLLSDLLGPIVRERVAGGPAVRADTPIQERSHRDHRQPPVGPLSERNSGRGNSGATVVSSGRTAPAGDTG